MCGLYEVRTSKMEKSSMIKLFQLYLWYLLQREKTNNTKIKPCKFQHVLGLTKFLIEVHMTLSFKTFLFFDEMDDRD